MRFGLLLLLLLAAPTAGARPRLVAVMGLEDRTRSLPPAVVEALTDALRTELARGGRYGVIDKSRQAAALKRLVVEQKKESYRACYDSSCQIPLGQALAADSILRTKLTRVGSYDLLLAELVDLAKEAVTAAAQARVPARPRAGREDRLLGAVSSLARELRGGTPTIGVLGGGGLGGGFGGPRRGPSPEELEQRRLREQERRRRYEERQARYREEQEQRRAERVRQREAAERNARVERAQRELVRSRRTRLAYGWIAIVSGGILGLTGVYYMTAKVSAAGDEADEATTPEALQTAADDADKHRVTGIVLTSLGAAAAGLGAYLVLSAPRLDRHWKVGGLELSPGAGPADGGFAFSLGGRF